MDNQTSFIGLLEIFTNIKMTPSCWARAHSPPQSYKTMEITSCITKSTRTEVQVMLLCCSIYFLLEYSQWNLKPSYPRSSLVMAIAQPLICPQLEKADIFKTPSSEKRGIHVNVQIKFKCEISCQWNSKAHLTVHHEAQRRCLTSTRRVTNRTRHHNLPLPNILLANVQ